MPDDGRSISRNVASLNILVHDVINLLYYTGGNLLDYEYFRDHYKLIAIDLSKQIELENPDLKQQINFIGRFEKNNATIFFIIERKEETSFDFSQNSVVVV